MAITARLSDEAFNGLVKQAKKLKYVRLNNWAYGLSRYLEDLSYQEFKDNRPPYLIDWKPLGYDIWFIPEYTQYTVPRELSLTNSAIENYTLIALRYSIFRVSIRPIPKPNPNNPRPFVVHFKRNQTKIMIVSAVLEAIGTDLLTPNSLVNEANWKRNIPRTKARELVW